MLSSLSPSPYSKVSNTLTESSPMIDSSVHTLFLSPASYIPVAISNLSQVFFQDFHRLDADLSFMFRDFGAGIFTVAMSNSRFFRRNYNVSP